MVNRRSSLTRETGENKSVVSWCCQMMQRRSSSVTVAGDSGLALAESLDPEKGRLDWDAWKGC